MKLYNSMTNKLEEFKPIHEGKVDMYVCGPTVYNYSHVGNARPIVVFDTLKRTLEAHGYDVKMVSNYTDVDDKIIRTAIELGVKEEDVTKKFIEAYENDRFSLHATEPEAKPRVTETMDAIIDFIDLMVKEGYAYEVDGDVYFRVDKVDEYGKLSNQRKDDLQVGARIDENTKKENPLDFTLWKETTEGIQWDSPWSKGRPGWHTECVVMIQREFGTNLIDIHGGGMDLKFPHHENEIAQSVVCNHTTLANYWVHNGMVNIEGEKMSKSLGNVIWTKDLVKEVGGNNLRWAMLAAHYRSPLNISDESLDSANKELNKIQTALKQIEVKLQLADQTMEGELVEEYETFLSAMGDDMNTPNALSALYELLKRANQALRTKELDYVELANIHTSLLKMLDVLGIELNVLVLEDEAKELYKSWEDAKSRKDFDEADTHRAKLIEMGIL